MIEDGAIWSSLTTVNENEDDFFVGGNVDVPLAFDLQYNEDFTPEFWGMLYGGPDPKSPAFAMQIKSYVCPVVMPCKRRGLTGKAYRSARRKYHRETRAWRRGYIPSTEILQVFYDVRPITLTPIPGKPDEASIEFAIH